MTIYGWDMSRVAAHIDVRGPDDCWPWTAGTKPWLRERNAGKTHCPRGHPLSGENLLNVKSGARVCKECARVRRQAHRARVAEREVMMQ
jgi:hypothetical protein